MEQERLANMLKQQRALGRKGDSWDNYALAYTQIEEELSSGGGGTFSDTYSFDDRLRDALLTNIRQDGIHALANTISITKSVRRLEILAAINF